MVPARLFAALYDRSLAAVEEAGLRDHRATLLAEARGRTVEIGAGTGANVGLYPAAVTSLVLTEPEEPMARRLRARLEAAGSDGREVEVVEASAEALPLPDASCDTAVCTLVLCTVPDPHAALAEIGRVLRPGGRLLFLEHVRADDPGVAKWQDRLTPAWRFFARGCHPNRDTAATLTAAGWRVETLHEDRLPKSPPITRPLIRGVAVPTA